MPAVVNPSIFDSFWGWFERAGPEVQAALIGNAGIVLAASLTVAGTALFAARQYRLERIEKARDRALAVKNDILFESVRGATRSLIALVNLGNLEKRIDEVSIDYQSGLASINLAGAVADIETVRAARDLVNALGPKFLERVVQRRPLDDLKEQIDHIQHNLDNQIRENEEILRIQRDALAAIDDTRARKANELFQAAHQVFAIIERQRSAAIAKLQPLQQTYARENFVEHAKLVPLLRNYVASVRHDIGIDQGDKAAYLDASYIDPQQALITLDKAISALESKNAKT